jgi:hypothetical protein
MNCVMALRNTIRRDHNGGYDRDGSSLHRRDASREVTLRANDLLRQSPSGGDVAVTCVPRPTAEWISIEPPIASKRASSDPRPM